MLATATKKTAKVGKAGSGVITSVRFDTRVRAAIDKAAKDDKRPTSTLIQIVMEEWLKAKGYLKAEIPAANEPPRDRAASSQILSVIPNLRAFAVSLCGNLDRADDLVQETLVMALKAWPNIGSFVELFVEGSNLRAWLFGILRNIYYTEYRKRRREVADPDGAFAAKLATAPTQSGHMDLLDFRAALQQLPGELREALFLIGASGLSYEEAAGICGCEIGTMKSRVDRARSRLADMLSIGSDMEFGHDGERQAIDSTLADQRYVHLRSVYDDVLAQPVPGRFLELLRQLESASHSRLSKEDVTAAHKQKAEIPTAE